MATVEQTMMKVQRIMTGPMGLQVMVQDDRFRVTFQDTSTFLTLRVVEWGKDDDGQPRTVVLVTAPILNHVDPTPELFEWVARTGGSRWFGHVEVHDAGDSGLVNLIFSHTLLGDYLDQPELETAMWGILSVANSWDEELQQKFGGKRADE
jgi:adenylate cyclase